MQPALNSAIIRGFDMPVPPVLEQQRIVAEIERLLSVVEELEATVASNLKRAERLRQAILKRAFEGRLVPQDPSDEPASLLLERIRTERTTTEGTVRLPRRRITRVKPPTPALQEPLPI